MGGLERLQKFERFTGLKKMKHIFEILKFSVLTVVN